MRVAVVAMVVGVIAGLIARGRPSNLLALPVRWTALLAVFLGATFAAHQGVPGAFGFLLLGMAAFAAFAFANALPVRGLLVVGVGLTLNLIVTADNHGMPYRPSAVVSAGAVTSTSADLVPSHSISSHPESESDQLMVFADIIPLRPLREVVSVGDILVAIGLGLVVFHGVLGDGQRKPRHLAVAVAAAGAAGPGDGPDAAAELAAPPATSASAWAPPAPVGAVPLDLPMSLAERAASPEEEAALDAERAEDAAWNERVRLLKATGDVSVIVDLTHDASSDALPSATGHDVHSVLNHVVRRVRNEPTGDGADGSPASLSARVAVLRALRGIAPMPDIDLTTDADGTSAIGSTIGSGTNSIGHDTDRTDAVLDLDSTVDAP